MQTTPANITWLLPDLATGGDLSLDPAKAIAQIDDILAQGVNLILDMRGEACDAAVWATLPVEYRWLPTDDAAGHTIPPELFDKAVSEFRNARAKGWKTLAHCHMGINRGPSVAYSLLLDLGHEPIAAWDLIRAKRPVAAVYYAPDALRAHHARAAREGNPVPDATEREDRLSQHIEGRLDERTRRAIQHTILTMQEQDRADYETAILAMQQS